MAKQKTKIIKFIEEISSKNYARAHKYLKSVIEDKITKALKLAKAGSIFDKKLKTASEYEDSAESPSINARKGVAKTSMNNYNKI